MKIILGTMTFSSQVEQSVATDILTALRQSGHREFDTAYVYNKGETEKLLGRMLVCVELEGTLSIQQSSISIKTE